MPLAVQHLTLFNQLADWLESYAHSMELNVWTSSTVESMKEVPGKGWSVVVKRGDGTRTFTPRNIVFAQGFGGGKPITPTYLGMVSNVIIICEFTKFLSLQRDARILSAGRSYIRLNIKLPRTMLARRSSLSAHVPRVSNASTLAVRIRLQIRVAHDIARDHYEHGVGTFS